MSTSLVIMVSNASGRLSPDRYTELLRTIRRAIESEPTISRINGLGYSPAEHPPFAAFCVEVTRPQPLREKVAAIAARYRQGSVGIVTGAVELAGAR